MNRPVPGTQRISRRSFLGGALVGAGAMWAGGILPARRFRDDPDRPPELYEYHVDALWFDSSGLREEPLRATLRGDVRADLAVIGGGFTGLASATHLARRFPDRRVVLLEGARCGYGASGRNGGFADVMYTGFPDFVATHGPERGRVVHDTVSLGMREIETLVSEHGVDCDLERNGSIQLATDDGQMEGLEAARDARLAMGLPARLLGRDEARRAVASERFVGGLETPDGGILDPAKLARGMLRVAEAAGVEVFEATPVLRLEPGPRVRVRTERGSVETDRAVLAVNGYAPAMGIFRSRLLPLCNYMVATEPLGADRLAALGWSGRQGLSDARVNFMYLRLTADGRIACGGETAPYFYDARPSSGNYAPALERLQASLLETFPQLAGVRFTHAWGGTMGFTRDFTPRIGWLDDDRRVLYALGFCGEGVVMSQVAARIAAALVAGEEEGLGGLPFVGGPPPWLGFEPLRYPAVRAMERALEILAGER